MNNFSGNSGSQPPRKKFDVISHQQQQPVVPPTRTRKSNKFDNITETRPRKCPHCGTIEDRKPGNIAKLDNGLWNCKSCDHKWR